MELHNASVPQFFTSVKLFGLVLAFESSLTSHFLFFSWSCKGGFGGASLLSPGYLSTSGAEGKTR